MSDGMFANWLEGIGLFVFQFSLTFEEKVMRKSICTIRIVQQEILKRLTLLRHGS